MVFVLLMAFCVAVRVLPKTSVCFLSRLCCQCCFRVGEGHSVLPEAVVCVCECVEGVAGVPGCLSVVLQSLVYIPSLS